MINSIRLVYVILQEDTRTLATEWISGNLSQGEAIMLNFQLMTLLPTHSAITRQSADYPDSVGTYWLWLRAQADEALSATTYNIYNKLYWDQLPNKAAQSQFVAAEGIRYMLVRSSVNNPTVDDMIGFGQENGRLVKLFCPAYDTSVAELPDDMYYHAWWQIWQLQRAGPFIALYDLHQSPDSPAVAEFCVEPG